MGISQSNLESSHSKLKKLQESWRPDVYYTIISSKDDPSMEQCIQTVRVKDSIFTQPMEQRKRIHSEIDKYREELRDNYNSCTSENLSAFYSIIGLGIGTILSYSTRLKLPFFICPSIGAALDFYILFDKCIPLRDRVDKLNVVAKKMDLLFEKQQLKNDIRKLSHKLDEDTGFRIEIPLVEKDSNDKKIRNYTRRDSL